MIRALFFTLGLLATTSALAAGTKEDCDTLEAGSAAQVWCLAYHKDTSLCGRQRYRDPYEDWCRAYATKNTGQCGSDIDSAGARRACELLAARERADDDRAELERLEELDAKDGYSMSLFIEAIARYVPSRCGNVRNTIMKDVCTEALAGIMVAREGAPEAEEPMTLSSASAALTGEAALLARGKAEARKWNFGRMLQDPGALALFRKRVEAESSGDQLDFVLAVKGGLSGSACSDLVQKYDLLSSAGAANISSSVRTNIERFYIVPFVTCETTGAEIGEGGASVSGAPITRIQADATYADQLTAASREIESALNGTFIKFSLTDTWYNYLGEL